MTHSQAKNPQSGEGDGMSKRDQLYANDAVWAAFYRDGKTLGEICKMFDCGVYDLSPWLTAPLIANSARSGKPDLSWLAKMTTGELEEAIAFLTVEDREALRKFVCSALPKPSSVPTPPVRAAS